MCELLLDVDIAVKLAAYDLLDAISHPGCPDGCERTTGVTAATKYVARTYLRRRASDPENATERLDRYLDSASVLEPLDAELKLAARLESEAARAGVALDTGESQLCAIAILRGLPAVLTGDKRAIAGAESLLDAVPELRRLEQRIACLEQAVTLAVGRIGALLVRERVIAESRIDTAVSICFQFTRSAVSETFYPAGLASYINSLRASAPTLLMAGEVLAAPSVA